MSQDQTLHATSLARTRHQTTNDFANSLKKIQLGDMLFWLLEDFSVLQPRHLTGGQMLIPDLSHNPFRQQNKLINDSVNLGLVETV